MACPRCGGRTHRILYVTQVDPAEHGTDVDITITTSDAQIPEGALVLEVFSESLQPHGAFLDGDDTIIVSTSGERTTLDSLRLDHLQLLPRALELWRRTDLMREAGRKFAIDLIHGRTTIFGRGMWEYVDQIGREADELYGLLSKAAPAQT